MTAPRFRRATVGLTVLSLVLLVIAAWAQRP